MVSGAGGVTIWGGDLDFVGGNFQEYGEVACGFSQTSDGKDVQVAEGQDLKKRDNGECTQRSDKADTGDLH